MALVSLRSIPTQTKVPALPFGNRLGQDALAALKEKTPGKAGAANVIPYILSGDRSDWTLGNIMESSIQVHERRDTHHQERPGRVVLPEPGCTLPRISQPDNHLRKNVPNADTLRHMPRDIASRQKV
jgi:hypothetical protein